MKKSVWFVAVALFVCSWGVAYAGTPDGMTPAEESICDKAGYTGALWGLCDAYCEAMDCDAKATNAADTACERVLDNFLARSQGKPPVCQKIGKPCVDQCGMTRKEDELTCKNQYDKALKTCKPNDIHCEYNAYAVLKICQTNAAENYKLCREYCPKPCSDECYDLHTTADDRCFDKFCNHFECDAKLLDACLENNLKLFYGCVKNCKGEIEKIP